jgi:DNA polymerase-3 subunit epsilon
MVVHDGVTANCYGSIMREIVLDTETTGLSPNRGDRIVDVACIELINKVPQRQFQRFINPEREVPAEAFNVHNLSTEFLKDFPVFDSIADEFLTFIEDSPLIIHNADFDMGFLNAELIRSGKPALGSDRALCTMQLARRRFPGQPASLDALCRRFGVDNSHRVKHGALVDCELLAEVYLELSGGRQAGLALATVSVETSVTIARTARPPRAHAASEAELAAHATLLGRLKNPLWTAGKQ